MNTKKIYKTPSAKVIEIAPSDIIATSSTVSLRLMSDYDDIEEEGIAD